LCATIWGMAFFDVPEGLPPDLPDEEPRPKPWTGPPLRTVPALLTEQVVLAHTDRVAVAIGSGRFRRQDNSHSSANGPRSRSR
jgi:hypothetical protein